MPHPARIDLPAILVTACCMLESAGPEGLTMRALARELGVSAPSLYFYIESRDDLLRHLISDGLERFGAVQLGAIRAGTPEDRARSIARAYIAFAEAQPQLFTLMFGPCQDDVDVDPAIAEAASAPVLEVAASFVGPERALFFAEALWSLVHGYTVLRLAGQFRQNPDHEAAFWFAVDVMLAGARVATPPAPR